MSDEAKLIMELSQMGKEQAVFILGALGTIILVILNVFKRISTMDNSISVVQNDMTHVKNTVEKIEGKIDNLDVKK